MSQESSHCRMQLNNLLQTTRGVQALTWEAYQVGPQHTAPWTAIAYIQGVEWGRGVDHNLSRAKEAAARQAYRALYRETYRMEPPNC